MISLKVVQVLVLAVSPDSRTALSIEIEIVRKQMNLLGEQLGFLHPDVQACSKKLDKLLLQYYELR
ncbi:aspartyl-phosphate phosphatase Spo0E family protein [Paenibacillus thalictri]|uniref:Aspartyl-phosphate phosphatase Spo0E family protein n=1 Tax=Paenibacillus thalictri TaxID=2527873 RepID=A0A4Q9DGY9_9BACL|nr:aspartyl-phosphate phosphatase Spo0E family protein [Paenibacillus thalictri]TBL71617.1 aspartyl-phosphate phosphatase Spo0E family protein [Paenibacillus thalictri]